MSGLSAFPTLGNLRHERGVAFASPLSAYEACLRDGHALADGRCHAWFTLSNGWLVDYTAVASIAETTGDQQSEGAYFKGRPSTIAAAHQLEYEPVVVGRRAIVQFMAVGVRR